MKIEYDIIIADKISDLKTKLNIAGTQKWEAIGGILYNNSYFHVLMARTVRD